MRWGNDVTLFASGDSQTSAETRRDLAEGTPPRWLRPRPQRPPYGDAGAGAAKMRRRRIRLPALPPRLFIRSRCSTDSQRLLWTTLHGRLDLPEHQPVFTTFSSVPVISISNAQRRPVPQANWVRTIYLRPAGKIADAAARDHPATSPCSAASRRKRASIGRSRSRFGAAFRSRSPPRSIGADQEYYDEIVRPLIEGSSLVAIYRRDRRS